MSTMKDGSRSSPTDANIVFQSSAPRGEKSLVPQGQLLLSCDRRTVQQLLHFTNGPAEYGPLRFTRSHLHVLGLPLAGLLGISRTPVHWDIY